MKSILIGLLLLAGVTITSFGENPERSPSEAIQIRWQKEIKHPLEGTDAPPPILYKKSPTTTNALVLMNLTFSYTNTNGVKETENVGGKLVELPLPESSGIVSNTNWFTMTHIMFLMRGLRGTGTVHVAFFEPLEQPSDKKAVYGQQLSNWLDLPISVTGPPLR